MRRREWEGERWNIFGGEEEEEELMGGWALGGGWRGQVRDAVARLGVYTLANLTVHYSPLDLPLNDIDLYDCSLSDLHIAKSIVNVPS